MAIPVRILPVFILSALLFAGCTGAGTKTPLAPSGAALVFDPDWDIKAVPFGEGHDHYNASQHQNLSTPNFKLLGWDPLISDYYGYSAAGYLCGDSADNGQRRLSVIHGEDNVVAFELVDTTDGRHPMHLGELVLPNAPSRDVAITPDGKYVLLGTSPPPTPPKTPPMTVGQALRGATWRSVCNPGGVNVPLVGQADMVDYTPYSNGAVLVSIEDVKAPKILSWVPLPGIGTHSIYANKIGANYYVLASIVNLVQAVSYVDLLSIETTPAGVQLVEQSVLAQSPLDSNAPLINGHNDGTVQLHPLTHKTYAYIANWHQGLLIIDISNPRLPQQVGTWSDNPPGNTNVGTNDYGDVHEAVPVPELWDGRHYTFIGQEIIGHPTSRPSGYVKAIETTDPSRPREVAMWTLPTDVEWQSALQFSTHYLTINNRTVFVSHYHAGVWAIDASGVGKGVTKLPAVGAFVPANVSPKPRPPPGPGQHSAYSWTPTVMESDAFPDGDVVIWDMTSGVYVAHFDASQPAPPKVWMGYG